MSRATVFRWLEPNNPRAAGSAVGLASMLAALMALSGSSGSPCWLWVVLAVVLLFAACAWVAVPFERWPREWRYVRRNVLYPFGEGLTQAFRSVDGGKYWEDLVRAAGWPPNFDPDSDTVAVWYGREYTKLCPEQKRVFDFAQRVYPVSVNQRKESLIADADFPAFHKARGELTDFFDDVGRHRKAPLAETWADHHLAKSVHLLVMLAYLELALGQSKPTVAGIPPTNRSLWGLREWAIAKMRMDR